jgi:2-haloacid dehalogenase
MDKTRPRAATPVPRAVLFDAYGTLFDVYSVGLLA